MLDKIIRKIPAFKGKQRLARFLFKKKITNDRDIVIKGDFNCCYKVPNIKENIGFEIFINGVYESDTIEWIAGKIPLNGNLIDIGANIGAICVPLCIKRNDINVLAVEASKNVFDYLSCNIRENGINNCIAINRAVSDNDGEMVSFFSPPDLFGKGSMAAVFTKEAEEIETITLDSLIAKYKMEKPDLIKMDVEGFEYFAFRGGEKLLGAADAPDILFEFVDWAEELAKNCKPGDAQKLLLKYGYDLWVIDNKHKLRQIYAPVTKGSLMIWATKKK